MNQDQPADTVWVCRSCGRRFFRDLLWGVCPTSNTGEHELAEHDDGSGGRGTPSGR